MILSVHIMLGSCRMEFCINGAKLIRVEIGRFNVDLTSFVNLRIKSKPMKSISTFLFACICLLTSTAQQAVKNGSFENWSTVSGVMVPDGYVIMDMPQSTQNNAVQRRSGGTNGSYSLRLNSYSNTFMTGGRVATTDTLTTIPGGLAFDYYQQHNPYGMNGVRVRLRFYDSTQAYIKDALISAPSGHTSMNFSSHSGYFSLAGTNAKFYTMEVYYTNINASASDYGVIDNIRFLSIGASAEDVSTEQNKIALYPNPVKNTLFISEVPGGPVHLEITGIDGKSMNNGSNIPVINQVADISFLQPGIYFVQLVNADGKVLAKQKITRLAD